MSVLIPDLEQVEHQIGEHVRQLRLLRSLRRILRRNSAAESTAARNRNFAPKIASARKVSDSRAK